ncbi:endonuclease [Haematobacter missouriensis]|uniref:Endonuclease n=1 Tax=Haematobacter missouriensis TaxID=366616 RepID=A0A212AXG1_9RHOB|nr:endonuclease/exonuclease/phosphatase family protein [Haematobacter missouriensis]KFI34164.1 endonuclease [Haematobacter missouriensis]OWJ72299.1 endonuclease [Haematobacter missouriensis]OWJ86148.1 endonuclease [Haematobacter missouriensis]
MRIATYNVEWFNSLFDDTGRLLEDDGWSGRHGVRRAAQIKALGTVFRAVDADAVMVVEAPDDSRHRATHVALESFAARFGLRTNTSLLGFRNDTQQEIALLYDPAHLTARHDPMGTFTGRRGSHPLPRFDGTYRIDLDIDGTEDVVTFSKPPLEVAAVSASGRAFRMIGVHIKSKAPHGAVDEDEVMRLSIQNRRKQLAQAIWLRERVLAQLARGDSLMVMGDFNDGPGLDEYEKLFGRSAVEIVMGWNAPKPERLYDANARRALAQRIAAQPASARFWLPDGGSGHYLSALLDYIMVSPDLRALQPRWRIWHPFDDPACYGDPMLREALLAASDHFPVSIDVPL